MKPIIGCEIYVAPGSIHEKKSSNHGRDTAYHLTLLATNDVGYSPFNETFYCRLPRGILYKPRVDKELLAKYSEGLIALSGCLKGRN